MTVVTATIASMCGRFVVAGAASDLVALFDIDLPAEDLPAASWNIAPTDRVPIVIDTIPKGSDPDAEPVRRLEAARWGLVPPWAKDVSGGVKAFNARIESVGENAQFKNAFRKRRAIVPATGYYEWRTVEGVKTPQFIHLPDDELFVFAGLYEWWRNPAAADDSPDKWLLSTSILTRDATGELAGIHDRMPVFLDPSLIDEWLDPGTEGGEELLEEVSAGGAELANTVEFHEVDRAVGNVRNNSPELVRPV
jgi:putative SOS response-associated peptidase YedK